MQRSLGTEIGRTEKEKEVHCVENFLFAIISIDLLLKIRFGCIARNVIVL